MFTVGWRSIPNFQSYSFEKKKINISIVIACRNEEKNLTQLLQALKDQTYNQFELVIVNDHSTDKTLEILETYQTLFVDFKIVSVIATGKKSAIAQGIHEANGELIITTDADCVPVTEWVETIVNFYLQTNADLVICPVKMIENATVFSELQALEFTSLIASGAGSAGVSMPIMCNAANMAFTKEAWLKSKNDLHNEEPSGDDVFLLLSIKKRNGKILFLKSQKALVYTQPTTSLKAFFKQRSRWAGKSKYYTDWQIISVGIVIFAICLIQISWLFLSIINIQFLLLYLLILGTKFVTDYLFLNYANSFFKLRSILRNSIILSLVYPLYILVAFIKSLITTDTNWK